MNLLAHQLLSDDQAEIAVGNYIADAVKGKQYLNYPIEIQKGILLHRRIDFWMDHHPISIEGMKRLRKDYHLYSTVIIDIFYDHFIAKNWQIYHPLTLEEFTKRQYSILQQFETIMPVRPKLMFNYMSRQNWLLHYQQLEGIKRALSGMTKRIKHNFILENSMNILLENYQNYEEEVIEFMRLTFIEKEIWKEEINALIS